MQRRAAAAYVAFFLVIAAGAYGVIAATASPDVTVQPGEAEHTLENGTTVSVDGRSYQVASISAREASGGGGGHGGGGGGIEYSATLEWVNASEQVTETWPNNGTIEFTNGTYRVLIPNVSSPDAFQLRPEPGDWANPHWIEGQQFVDVDIDGDGYVESDVPIARFIAGNESLANRTIQRDATFRYSNNDTRVISLTNDSATVAWNTDVTHTVELAQGSNVTLNGRTYLTYFSDEQTVYLDSVESTRYFERQGDKDAYHRRTNGLWTVSILSGLAIVLLVGLAYMPRRR